MIGIDLAGQVALISGASRGIGRAMALGLAQAGADVVIAARDEAALEVLAKEMRGAGGSRVEVAVTDVTDPEAIHRAVATAVDTFGKLDIVVNNAGGNTFSAPMATMRPEGWAKTIRLNLDSVMHSCQAVAPHLLGQGSGSVINVASVAGLRGAPFMSHYAAAKAGVISLTQSLALEWAHAGVRVNAICPGWIQTDLTAHLHGNEQASAGVISGVPMGRWGTPEDIVGPMLFLASAASAFVTGQVVVVDGGLTLV